MTDGEKPQRKPRIQRLREVLPLAWGLVRPRLPSLIAGLALIVVSRGAGLVMPAMAKVFIDDVIPGTRPEAMREVLIATAAAALVQILCAYALFHLLTVRSIEFVADLRTRGIAQLIRLSVPFYDRHRSGSLLPRVLQDLEALKLLVGSGFIEFTGAAFFSLLAAGYMWTLSARLTSVALLSMILFGLLLVWAFWIQAEVHSDRSRLMAEATGRLSETLQGIRVVKAYRAEARESESMAAAVLAMQHNAVAAARNSRTYSLASTIVLSLSGLALMGLALGEIRSGRLTMGGLTTFVILLGYLSGPIYMLVALLGQFADALVCLERLDAVLKEPAEKDAATAEPCDPTRVRGEVRFENVTFEYQTGEPVLHGVTFEAREGTATALVGPSGAGKSTIMGLLAAFYRPQSGRILLDGRDIAGLRLADYRASFGVVFQETFLFDATLRENILFARPEASEAEFLSACASAHVEEFATRLEKGYDTLVGERGVRLSGGQRQRVAIARAFLANPRILLLDEATSSLDTESESLIQRGLAALLPERTTFVIAHRLSTVRQCHQILVLDRGALIERGTDAELRAAGGRYAAMLRQQTEGDGRVASEPS